MSLDQYALTTVDAVKAWCKNAGIEFEANGIWIYCSASGATAATVEVTDTTMVLIITGGGSAGTNTLTFADSDKNTISELITAINALTGWKSGRLTHSDADSTDLVVTGALSCVGAANEVTLKIVDNYFIERLIERATDFWERYFNRKLDSRDYSREIYYGSGYQKLLLDQYPVSRVTRVSIGRSFSFSIKNTSTDMNYATVEVTSSAIRLIVDGGDNEDDTSFTLSSYSSIDSLITAIEALSKGWDCTAMATDTDTRDASDLLPRPAMYVDSTTIAYLETPNDELTDYKLLKPSTDRNTGILWRSAGWDPDTEYFIDYTAGYSTIPYLLEELCIRMAAYKYGMSKRAGSDGLKSESFGEGADYSYARFDTTDISKAIPPDMLAEASVFKKMDI